MDLIVEEAIIEPPIDPSLGGGGGEFTNEETFFHKVWRFILGLLGLDSAPPESSGGVSEPIPEQQFVPIPAGGGGGKG